MATRVPTTTKICLNCKINSDANAGKEFHEIFDEVGLELQLPFLVKTFFHINLNKKDEQHLCDDCVNRLIELYDVMEHTKKESCRTNNYLRNEPECSNNEVSGKNESGNFRYEHETFHNRFVIDQNNTQVILPKSNSIESTNFTTFDLTQADNAIEINEQNRTDRTEYENIENVGHFFKQNSSSSFTQQQNQRRNDIAEDFPEEHFQQTGEKKVSQDSDEHIEFISDDENHNVGINEQSNANIIVGSKKFEVKEFEVSQDSIISLSSSEKLDELVSNEHIIFISDDENQNVEIDNLSNTSIVVDLCEEVDEAVEAYIPNKIHNQIGGQTDLHVKIVDDRSNQELEITEENEASLLNVSRSATEFNNIENIGADNLIVQEGISNETCSLEKVYLMNETILSEEYDNVDLNEYLDKVLGTKFQDLTLNWEMECKLCLKKYCSLGELLNHACMTEIEKEQQFSCIIKDCEEHAKDVPTLARHLVLKHYDKLESTAIYGKCTDCQKTFSNVLEFNKHSCCRNIKQKIGTPSYCKYCDLNFQSFKRYVFHMQFHLKNHRPKICLLCGDLFNNSNDFFEHTQYKHIPTTALTCKRCDRFYKDIQVFNMHMEVHDESKCLHECAHCPKKYTTKFALGRHMDIYHNNKSNALKCEYCSKKFWYKTAYRNHIKTHAANVKVQTFICSTCGLITRTMEMIKVHIESDKESVCFSSPFEKKMLGLSYSCENCSLDFCTIQYLKDHRLSDSHSDYIFNCCICRKSFNTLNRMRKHSSIHKDFKEWQESFPITRNFVCNIGDCQEFYSIWTSLYYHKKRPHKTKEETNSRTEFKCQFCHQVYLSKQSLAFHISKSHNERSKCSYCKRNFNSETNLQKHIDTFHSPVECNICLMKFKHRPHLETHINSVHSNKNIQKGYFNKNQGNLHEKKVRHNNTFICKLCNFETTCPETLKNHVDNHNNQPKLKCLICSKLFGRKKLLEWHLKKHQNKRNYSCAHYLNESGCDAYFYSYKLLKKHAQTKHENSTFSINLKIKRRRKTKNHDVVKFENVSCNTLTCDDSSKYEKQAETSHDVYLNDEDFEQDAIVSTLETDMEFEELKPDTESLTI